MRLYAIPLFHLRNLSSVYIPADGKYIMGGKNYERLEPLRERMALAGLGSETHADSVGPRLFGRVSGAPIQPLQDKRGNETD